MAPAFSSFLAVKDGDELVSVPPYSPAAVVTLTVPFSRKAIGLQQVSRLLYWHIMFYQNLRVFSTEKPRLVTSSSQHRLRHGWVMVRATTQKALI